MALADSLGPESDECVELARLASRAVDFPKTGVAVSIGEIPVIEAYPDFMNKVGRGDAPYSPPRILGTSIDSDLGLQDYTPLQETEDRFVREREGIGAHVSCHQPRA